MSFVLFMISISLTDIRLDSNKDTTAKMISLYPEIDGIDYIENLLFTWTNQERQKRGLKSLKMDKRLRIAARQHSNDMLRKKYLSHNSKDEINKTPLQRIYNSGLPVLAVGENIAESVGDMVPVLLKKEPDSLAKLVMKGWMNSPPHKKNILHPDYTHMGIGAVADGELHKVTQNFADESDFTVDSVLAEVNRKQYSVSFYMSSFVSGISVFDNGKPLEFDSVYIRSGRIDFPLKRDSSLHKVELCLKEEKFYRCGVRLFIHTAPPAGTIFQPLSSKYK